MDWQDLALTSHYGTAKAVQQQLLMGNIEEALTGIEELTEALGRSDKRALRSQLTRLMAHIIKWNIQPERRSRSWLLSIKNARREIRNLLEDEPGQKPNIPKLWDQCFQDAKEEAEDETDIIADGITSLTWQEIFEDEYKLTP